jgi:hypothetical protein
MGGTLQSYQRICFSIDHEAETSHGKKKTRITSVILIGIQVACSFYKLAHGTKYFECNELFAIDKSTLHLVLQEFFCAMNI